MIKQKLEWLYRDEIEQANKDGWEVTQIIKIDEYSQRGNDFYVGSNLREKAKHMEPHYFCLLTYRPGESQSSSY